MDDGEQALHAVEEVLGVEPDNIPAQLLRSEAHTLLEDYEAGSIYTSNLFFLYVSNALFVFKCLLPT